MKTTVYDALSALCDGLLLYVTVFKILFYLSTLETEALSRRSTSFSSAFSDVFTASKTQPKLCG